MRFCRCGRGARCLLLGTAPQTSRGCRSRRGARAASTTSTAAPSPRSLTRHVPDVEATAEVTAASVENLDFLAQGSADLAFSLADTAADAVAGRERFPSPLPVCALASLYDNVTHVVVDADGPVRTLADLRGRRVSLGAPNSGTEVIAARVLRAAGLDPARDVAARAPGRVASRPTRSRTGRSTRSSGRAGCRPPRSWSWRRRRASAYGCCPTRT